MTSAQKRAGDYARLTKTKNEKLKEEGKPRVPTGQKQFQTDPDYVNLSK